MPPCTRPRWLAHHFAQRVAVIMSLLLTAALLAACQADLYVDLDQRQANEMIAVLMQHGIPAERLFGKNGRITVRVADGRFGEAVRILNDNGLPRQDFASLGQVFDRGGLVPSPEQKRAQMMYAL